ncbi:nicotinate-nucleotide--dimethylbenzimidazole phosphoribosyltransferase [Streptomyces sp. P38-E01]|uniref:Nicotinate-nucleotide--dimethylbenzimidazole phosphoribosyltransferase n=1 Tax=Streptomyces tardus TaxID=2780544 RepID=A0A949JTN4_9ACTN|nr:nicotinate-nucleotide--dimethylbenzimidazole phosphoribosyltransferase [Streptomyces tardus]MBU7599935.1 nicotinate-nucleotide--dimethylbenzimidazole phosphoribosyltransferase [Streptomyces tardus]
MTDTGRMPGEGQPENAGAPQEEPGAPAPVGHTYAPPRNGRPGSAGSGRHAQDDLLLMPSSQGAWGDPGAQPFTPQPVPADAGYDGAAAAVPHHPEQGPHVPEGHEADGRDSGAHDYSAVRTPPAGSPVPGADLSAAHEGMTAVPGEPAPGEPSFGEAPAGAVPVEPAAVDPLSDPLPGDARSGGAPAGDPLSDPLPGEPPATGGGAPGDEPQQPVPAQSWGGRQTQPSRQPSATAPRRPLHLGPPVPEQSGAVRSLAERGPSTQPGTAFPAPVESGVRPAAEPAAAPHSAPGAHDASLNQTAPPAPSGEQGLPAEPEYLDVPPADQLPQQPEHFEDPSQLPGPQLGALPPQEPDAWSAQPVHADAAVHPVEHPLAGPDPVAEPVAAPGAVDPSPPAEAVPVYDAPQPVAADGSAGVEPAEPVAAEPGQVEPVAAEAGAAAEAVAEPVEQPAPQGAQEQAAVDGAPVQDPGAAIPAQVGDPDPLSATAQAVPAPREAEASAVNTEDGSVAPGPDEVSAAEPTDLQLPEPEGDSAAAAASRPEEAQHLAAEPAPEPAPSAEPVAQEEPAAPAAAAPEPALDAPAAPQAPTPDAPTPDDATPDDATPDDAASDGAALPGDAVQPSAESAESGASEPGAPEPAPVEASGPPAPGYPDAEREAVHRAIRERRDVRNGFRDDPIPHEVLLRVLEAAHTAPSVGHSQPWDFVIIRSPETRQAMHELALRQRDAYAKSLPKARAKQFKELKVEAILDTPVNIVVTADPTRGGRHTLGRHSQPQTAPYSSALAVENLWLAARAEGLGVGWVSFFDERETVRELGLPEHLEVVAYLCVGYVDAFPEEPELVQSGWSRRRPLSWVVHEESYGRRVLPGAEPHDLLGETLAAIRPLDAKALGEAWERQKRMTKPAGALGMLEIISAQLSGLARQCPPPVPEPAAVAVFAGDHGVHDQHVTSWPQEVTAQMVDNFLSGGAVCNAFAKQVGAEVCVVDVGVAQPLPSTPGLLPRKVRAGTADFTTTTAMTREEAQRAVEVGIETARDLVAAGNKALLTGEMGIANTTVSAALISVFTGVDPLEVTGRGTGISDEMHAHKAEVVRRALELHQVDPTDPIGVLAAVGGLEHAALVGLILGGASLRTPVLLDGVSAGAAALVARAMAPEALAACIAGHRSPEPGHHAALTTLGLRPLVDLELRLGEGTGALLALPVVQSAARAMHDVATFDAAGVTEKN